MSERGSRCNDTPGPCPRTRRAVLLNATLASGRPPSGARFRPMTGPLMETTVRQANRSDAIDGVACAPPHCGHPRTACGRDARGHPRGRPLTLFFRVCPRALPSVTSLPCRCTTGQRGPLDSRQAPHHDRYSRRTARFGVRWGAERTGTTVGRSMRSAADSPLRQILLGGDLAPDDHTALESVAGPSTPLPASCCCVGTRTGWCWCSAAPRNSIWSRPAART